MTTYTAGRYQIQWRGRGPVIVNLTKAQAKALFELQAQIPHFQILPCSFFVLLTKKPQPQDSGCSFLVSC